MKKPAPLPTSANQYGTITRFACYTSSGAIAAIIHFLILILLVQFLFFPPVLASIMGYIVGATVNFLLNHHWVFQSSRPHAETAPKFFLIAASGLGLNATMMYFLVTMLQIHYLLGQIATTSSVLVWNYYWSSRWTFTRNPEE